MSSKYILKTIFLKISNKPELVVIISIGWCAFTSGVAKLMGVSIEMGALIGGLSIASFQYSLYVTAQIVPLRDFFLILYFASLGMKIKVPSAQDVNLILFITGFVFASRLFTIITLYKIQKGGLRNAFLASLNLSQISEFSLIIASAGVHLNHISNDIFLILLYSMSFMSILSSYVFKFKYNLFNFFNKLSYWVTQKSYFEKKNAKISESSHATEAKIFILGAHHGAIAFLEFVISEKPDMLPSIKIIDFNEESLKKFKKIGVQTGFGDISDRNTLEHYNIQKAKIIICLIPDMLLKGTSNKELTVHCRNLNPDAFIIMTADTEDKIQQLKEVGVNDVLLPYFEMALHLFHMLQKLK